MDAVVIREVLPEDADALVSLQLALFAESDFMLFGPGEYSATVEDVKSQLERARQLPTNRGLIAEGGGAPIGFLNVTGSPVPRLRAQGRCSGRGPRSPGRPAAGRPTTAR